MTERCRSAWRRASMSPMPGRARRSRSEAAPAQLEHPVAQACAGIGRTGDDAATANACSADGKPASSCADQGQHIGRARMFSRSAPASERTSSMGASNAILHREQIENTFDPRRVQPLNRVQGTGHGAARNPDLAGQAAAAGFQAGGEGRFAVRKLVEDMFETMYDAPGIGLAAIQIGEPRRMVTMDLAKKDEPKEPQVFINPEIDLGIRGEENPRGRLPVDPGILRGGRAAGRRSRLKYLDLDGKSQEIEARGCSPPASSTRSTTSTACCSSTTFQSSSATASSRNSPRRPRSRGDKPSRGRQTRTVWTRRTG